MERAALLPGEVGIGGQDRERDRHSPRPEYRPARLGDLEGIATLEARAFDEPYVYFMLRQMFDLFGSDWLVAEYDGAVVGYVLILKRNRHALLFSFAVAEHLRGYGCGARLLRLAVQRFPAMDVDSVYLTVRPENERARKLFEQTGFVWEQHDPNYFGPGESRDILIYSVAGT
ncbi:MAG: GNAT family N-acetyltransferase [Nocardia sp.]|nr:GNAT family N-acetyltransferase [Nocardia sp.]